MPAIAKQTRDELILRSGAYGVSNAYQKSLVDNKCSAGKAELRDKVVNLVLENCVWRRKPSKQVRMITFPGPQWNVEREIFEQTGRMAHFTAFEQTLSLMHKGLVNVPRREEGQRLMVDWKSFEALRVNYFKTTQARWINMNFLDWCLLEADNMLQHARPGVDEWDPLYDPYDHWLRKFWTYDCMWLDFTSNLHEKMANALSRLPGLQGFDLQPVKPVVVTIQAARERSYRAWRDLGMTRTEFLAFLLDRKPEHEFEVVEEHSYLSASNVRMDSILGLWRRDPIPTDQLNLKSDD